MCVTATYRCAIGIDRDDIDQCVSATYRCIQVWQRYSQVCYRFRQVWRLPVCYSYIQIRYRYIQVWHTHRQVWYRYRQVRYRCNTKMRICQSFFQSHVENSVWIWIWFVLFIWPWIRISDRKWRQHTRTKPIRPLVSTLTCTLLNPAHHKLNVHHAHHAHYIHHAHKVHHAFHAH